MNALVLLPIRYEIDEVSGFNQVYSYDPSTVKPSTTIHSELSAKMLEVMDPLNYVTVRTVEYNKKMLYTCALAECIIGCIAKVATEINQSEYENGVTISREEENRIALVHQVGFRIYIKNY